jgi:hypothetical protein
MNLLLAGVTVLLAFLATLIAFQTLKYMRGRDAEVDTRNAWTEVHKAMINLRVQRALVMLQLGQMGAYGQGTVNPYDAGVRDYTLARAQLRAQLDRVNESDPLIISLATFLDENLLTTHWQTKEFETAFDRFVHQAATKSCLVQQ